MQAKPAVQGQHAIDSQRRLLSFAASRRPKRGVPTRLPYQEHLVSARLLEYRTEHMVPTKRRASPQCDRGMLCHSEQQQQVFMNIHEHQAKELLARYGVAVPRGGAAFSVDEAVKVANELGERQ